MIIHKCHQAELTVNPFIAVNTIGAEWYFACPNDPEDCKRILEFWEFFADNLTEADIFTIFPGDPGGCNRNGCNHVTFIELAAELAHMLKDKIPGVEVEVGTWGNTFYRLGRRYASHSKLGWHFCYVGRSQCQQPGNSMSHLEWFRRTCQNSHVRFDSQTVSVSD